MIRRLIVAGACLAVLRGAPISADSDRGAALFVSLDCIQCHSVNGRGGTVGRDLGRLVDRSFTPASLAATMWNHAPTMWPAIRERGLPFGDLNEQAAADLFAYFYSARFFDKPGDAARGKHVFETKHCAECHGLTEPKLPEAKPVSAWQSIGHPVALVDAMWNHAAFMKPEFARQHIAWASLTSQDVSDMLVYLRNLPSAHFAPPGFAVASGAHGQELFQSKGCVACHTGKLDLPPLLVGKTLTDIAVEMWNHAPRMAANPPQLSVEEMRDVVSYLWAGAFFKSAGNAAAGERVFTAKHCVACHNDPSSGAPQLTAVKGSLTAAGMVSALWHHGPRMLVSMHAKGIRWPNFNAQEMSNLIAYLDATGGQR